MVQKQNTINKDQISHKSEPSWHALSVETALKMAISSRTGLADAEARRRLGVQGKNSLPEKKRISRLNIFLHQFSNPLVYILLASAGISLAFKHLVDAGVILSAVFLNSIIGFIQENKISDSLEKLRSFIKPAALVVREGRTKEISASELVPGDIVCLRAGNNVPADCRLISADNLEINEAVLTGESYPSGKNIEPVPVGSPLAERKNMAYMGASIACGRGAGLVVGTGRKTELGRIAKLLDEEEDGDNTPLKERLNIFTNQLGIIVVAVSIFIFILGLSSGHYQPFEMFFTAVAIAVAAIPEGLPIAVTVILAIGTQKILKERALVRRLIAAETLGSVTTICTDKTGTITEGRMRLAGIIFPEAGTSFKATMEKTAPPELSQFALRCGLLCNEAVVEGEKLGSLRAIGSPTDEAILNAALETGLNYSQEKSDYPRIRSKPFDSKNKYMASLHEVRPANFFFDKDAVMIVKGAPEIVFDNCVALRTKEGEIKLDNRSRNKLKKEVEKLAGEGLRLIALAYRNYGDNEKDSIKTNLPADLVLLGLFVLKDPLRTEAKETIDLAKEAGIRTIIITGDHPATALSIAREAGLELKESNIIEGRELDELDDKKFAERVKEICLYARVSPQHKSRIVHALIASGEVVAMAGDGVNDAPAMRAADIGIALGSGTDVAKEASDLILLDNNYRTIIYAVEQGRIIFSNIRKVIAFLLLDCFSEVILIAGSILLGKPLALLPAQVLWINIINDGFPNTSLAFEKGGEKILKRNPYRRNEPLLNKPLKLIIFGVGTIWDILAFALFMLLIYWERNIDYARTVVFACVGLSSVFSIFSLRSLHKPVWRMNPFGNPWLVFAAAMSSLFMVLAIYLPFFQEVLSTVPLDASVWPVIIALSASAAVMIEGVKYWFVEK
jgi:calcium-translocating P-type ATPase